MNASDTPPTPPRRGPFQGTLQIVRFNWPMYVVAAVMSAGAMVVATVVPLPTLVRGLIVLGTFVGLFWAIGSLVASYWVYDRSPLCRWRWIAETLPSPPANWRNIHCGFDESTPDLRAMFPGTAGRSLDVFDAAEMTEASIVRARQIGLRQNPGEPADYRKLPAADASTDAVFLILAAHELRHAEARAALFREVCRVLRPGGRVVVVEHLRDVANFIAFGPGFLHFHSRRTWLATFRDGGLIVEQQFGVTPFVAVFVLARPA